MRRPLGRVPRLPVWAAAGLAASLILPGALLLAQGLEAVLVDVKGEVEWSPAGATQWQRAGAATVIHTGDRVRTSANSAARLAYSEGSTTLLAASTGVRVDDLTQDATAGSSIKLLQTSGVTQASVQPAPATAATTTYEVESPAAVASAPPTTCPWVHVGQDGTTLVRNYVGGSGAGAAGIPQVVQEVRYNTIWMPTPYGPRLTQVATTVNATRTIPVSTAADQLSLAECTFSMSGEHPTPTDTLALDLTSTASKSDTPLVGSIQIAGLTPEPDARLPLGGEGRVLSQGPGQVINVRNASGSVGVPPGAESQIVPGQAPSSAVPIGTFAAAFAAQNLSTAAQNQAQAANQAGQAISQYSGAFGQAGTNAAINQQIQQMLNPQQRMPSTTTAPSSQSSSSSSSSSSHSPTPVPSRSSQSSCSSFSSC